MEVNPEFNKILAEALAKADAQKDFIPMYVIEDIKQEIEETYRESIKDDINYAEGLERAWIIIDKHISGKEN